MPRLINHKLLAALALLATTERTQAATTPAVDNMQQYADCMTQARQKPEDALENAISWERAGGGAPAQHCAAVAKIGLGKFAEAAEQMQDVAAHLPGSQKVLAADLLGQAAQAWLMAQRPPQAHAALTAALSLDPGNVELRIDRGLTLAYQKKFWEALDDFNEARAAAPDRSDILVFIASAYRYLDTAELDTSDLAWESIQEAVKLDPDNPEALLERGLLRRLRNDPAGARADWLQIVKLAPGTPAADAAQANIERLDVKTN